MGYLHSPKFAKGKCDYYMSNYITVHNKNYDLICNISIKSSLLRSIYDCFIHLHLIVLVKVSSVGENPR